MSRFRSRLIPPDYLPRVQPATCSELTRCGQARGETLWAAHTLLGALTDVGATSAVRSSTAAAGRVCQGGLSLYNSMLYNRALLVTIA
jgi:hypothetical protein